MARDKVKVQLPKIDNLTTVAEKELVQTTVTQANGVVIEKPLECMRNTTVIMVTNSDVSNDSTVTFKKGDAYPNSMRGDKTIAVGKGKTVVLMLQDPSQFINREGNIDVDFATGFTGTIAVIGKPTGVGQGH